MLIENMKQMYRLFFHICYYHICTVHLAIIKDFYYQLMHKRIVSKGVLKFTLKQLQHVSV